MPDLAELNPGVASGFAVARPRNVHNDFGSVTVILRCWPTPHRHQLDLSRVAAPCQPAGTDQGNTVFRLPLPPWPALVCSAFSCNRPAAADGRSCADLLRLV